VQLSHHSFVQYRLPGTGELVPLLQIIPSKTDAERLLVISPELADVLSAIISRIRGTSNAVPLTAAYDDHERLWLPPAPVLFHSGVSAPRTARSPPPPSARSSPAPWPAPGWPAPTAPRCITPPRLPPDVPHRRDHERLPPHIAQVIAGHRDINVTLGYKAVYPEEAIQATLAFRARRRALRPTEEYRTPTDAEREEFLGLPVNCTSS